MIKIFKWIIVVGICLVLFLFLITFLRAFFFRNYTVGKIINLDIPKSTRIVDYKFSLNTSFDIDQFYAKINIDRDIYNIWKDDVIFYQINEINEIIASVNRDFKHETLNLENVDEVLFKEKYTSKYTLFFAGSTRWIVSFTTKEPTGDYYLYVMYK